MIQDKELSGQEIRQEVQEIAKEHLPLEASGYKCTSEMIYDVLMKAATENISIEAACQDLEGSVCGTTIRDLLNEQLSDKELCEQEKAMNEALAARLPEQIRSGRLEAAMDEHDEPFYGKKTSMREKVCRSKAKQGTTRFIRIATAYVIYRQMRLTLAIAFVLPEDETVEIVSRLHQQLGTLKLNIGVLYLDRGFCCGSVISYLKEEKQPAILACTIRGKEGGTRQLCRGRKSYRTSHTFTDGTVAQMAVVATLPKGKDKKRRRKWLLYVVIGLDWKPKTIHRFYRFRFGIESTYRILRRIRIKTTSQNSAFRFFALAFALILVNIWAFLRWFIARIPGPGHHRVDPTYFRFQLFVNMLRRSIEYLYGTVDSLPVLSFVSNS